jgi:uncharacterized protein (TIGR03437 family)
MRLRLLTLAAAALFQGSSAFAYLAQIYTPSDGSGAFALKRFDNTGIQMNLNNLVVAGLTSSLSGKNVTVISANTDPFSTLQSAQASWNSVGSANIRFLPLQSTGKAGDRTDLQNVVFVAATADDLSVLGGPNGALAATINAYAPIDGNLQSGVAVKKGQIYDSDIVINPSYPFSADRSANTADLQAVLLHELGHLLGANHSGPMGTTMNPFPSFFTARYLGSDEKAYATFTYPAGAATLGTLSGKVTLGDGTTPVKFGLMTFIDQAAGTMLGGLTANDGTYSIQIPPGNYIVYAEPFNSLIGPGNIYDPSAPGGILDSTRVTTGYLPTLLTGPGGSPATQAVAAGATTAAPLLITSSGASSISIPLVGAGAAGGSGGSFILTSFNGAKAIPSGQTFDLLISNGGVDASTTLQIYGPQGISIKPGSVRVDPVAMVNGQPVLRATITVNPQLNVGLASVWLTKGAGVTSFTGGFVIVPPIPTVSSVQDAESGRTTIVPGSWVAIYGNNLSASALRIWGAADFVNGNLLPNNLDGVTVTFNGISAPVYFTAPGQMNVQAPGNINGTVPVVVINNGSVAASFTATVVPSAPSFFIYNAGSKTYTAAVHAVAPAGCASPCIVGDPAVTPGTAKAKAGETIIFYVNGLSSSPGGVIISDPIPYTLPVNVSIAGQDATTSFAGLVAAGEFQLNVRLPDNLAAGDQTISVSTQGQTSNTGVTIPIGQ